MKDFRTEVNERIDGMYSTLMESNSEVLLEGFVAKKLEKDLQMAKKGFLKYLKKRYPDFNESEITNAETEEEMAAVKDKYMKDFKNYAELKEYKLYTVVNYIGAMLTGATTTPIGTLFSVLFTKNVGQWIYKHIEEKKERKGKNNPDRSFNGE